MSLEVLSRGSVTGMFRDMYNKESEKVIGPII